MTRERGALFPVDRALELAADGADVCPVRVHRLGFPLHVAEIAATVRTREAFDLLDEYVSRAVAEGGFRSVAGIAEFLGISEHMVDRVRRFLAAVGHMTGDDGSLALTEDGARAALENKRYTEKQDRIRLYFDGVRGEPLPVAYYRKSARIMTADEAMARDQHAFRPFLARCDFRDDTASELARRPDRAEYGMPHDYADLTVITSGGAYLPSYLIIGRDASGPRSLVYTGVDDASNDTYIERLLVGWPAIDQLLGAGDDAEERRGELTNWLHKRRLELTHLAGWSGDGVPRLILPAKKFLANPAAGARGEFSLTKLGSYATPANYVIQLWCTDADTRREAALLQGLVYADRGSRVRKPDDVTQFLARLCRRLEIATLSVADLRTYARRTGRGPLDI